MASFWKPKACGQTVLPDRSVLKGQKLVENAKIEKLKCDILSNFQTMCTLWVWPWSDELLRRVLSLTFWMFKIEIAALIIYTF